MTRFWRKCKEFLRNFFSNPRDDNPALNMVADLIEFGDDLKHEVFNTLENGVRGYYVKGTFKGNLYKVDGEYNVTEKRLEKLMKMYGLNRELAWQVIDSPYASTFEKLVKELDVEPKLIASTLENVLKSLKREGVPTENLTEDHLRAVFKAYRDGLITKE